MKSQQRIIQFFLFVLLLGPLTLPAENTKITNIDGALSIKTFMDIMINEPERIQLVDVRDEEQYKSGSISGAINVPINKLEKSIDTLPSKKPIVFYCHTAKRASEAYDMVRLFKPRLEVYYLRATVDISRDGTYQLTPKE